MKHTRVLLGAGLAAASLVTPASAQGAAGNNIVYTVTATAPGGASQLTAGCVFVADRWTADYGPTHVSGVATSGTVASSTSVTCTVKQWGNVVFSVSDHSSGQVALIQNERKDTIGTAGITVCVDAHVQGVVDVAYSASRCA